MIPEASRYFILSTHDDEWDVGLRVHEVSMGWRTFLTTAGVIGVIDSVLAGVLTALALTLLPDAGLLLLIGGGVAVFLLSVLPECPARVSCPSVLLHQRYQVHQSRRAQHEVPIRFPAKPANHRRVV
jgi:hypothetical protein